MTPPWRSCRSSHGTCSRQRRVAAAGARVLLQSTLFTWLALPQALHARIRRYTSPDEHAFFPDMLPVRILCLQRRL